MPKNATHAMHAITGDRLRRLRGTGGHASSGVVSISNAWWPTLTPSTSTPLYFLCIICAHRRFSRPSTPQPLPSP
jgi:hypothetical protein